MNESRDQDLPFGTDADGEIVDGVVVPEMAAPAPRQGPVAERQSLLPASPATARAVTVAVGGFAAGAVTLAVVRRRRTRKAARGSRRARKELGGVLGSRSFLVDVHLLGNGRD
jgi:hypothetical protein